MEVSRPRGRHVGYGDEVTSRERQKGEPTAAKGEGGEIMIRVKLGD